MKSNPFYALSAFAMLLGCFLLSQALELQAGQLRGLLLLMLVLQVYEGLLVGLGVYLVATGRAPRDGLVVLVIEAVFLLDATLLAAECVTTDRGAGTWVALALAALAALKLGWVRRAAPDVLCAKAAAVLGAHAAFILGLPVAAAHLAEARLLSPLVLYGFWWTTAALPLARKVLLGETQVAGDERRVRSAWTWVPSILAVLHLWTVGYIHTLDFRPAFLTPLLLGLTLTVGREQVKRKLMLPGLALCFSFAPDSALALRLFGADGVVLSPLRLALVAVGLVYAYLAWRDRELWLACVALGGGVVGLMGSSALRLLRALGRLLSESLPRDDFGWGALTVIAAFVLLAAGARRSLHAEPRSPRRRSPHAIP